MGHLKVLGETYWQHARFALWAVLQLLLCVATLFVHALLPNVLEYSTSRRLRSLLFKMIGRHP